MSDLAPLFTDVAEVLRCQTVQDLVNENENLKKQMNTTRIVVSAAVQLDEHQPTRVERTVAEGFLEQMEILTLTDIPERYSSLFRNGNRDIDDDVRRPIYAVKLQPTNAWIGRRTDFEDITYIVRLEKTDMSIILGVYKEVTIQLLKYGCLYSELIGLDRDVEDNSPNTMVELKKYGNPTSNNNQHFLLEHIGCKVDAFENHPYWNDLPSRRGAPRDQQQEQQFDLEFCNAFFEFMDNSPFFTPVDASEFLRTL
jgi:hypothetical protein